jgi:capsule polysaccharide modification protein KpsS
LAASHGTLLISPPTVIITIADFATVTYNTYTFFTLNAFIWYIRHIIFCPVTRWAFYCLNSITVFLTSITTIIAVGTSYVVISTNV